jgi:hypothetical protein
VPPWALRVTVSRNVGTEAFEQLVVIPPLSRNLDDSLGIPAALRRRARGRQVKRDPLGGARRSVQ